MGTELGDPLASTLFPGSRRAILAILYSDPDRPYYLREIIRLAGAGNGQIQRELTRLTECGIIRRFSQGRHVYFQANSACPVYDELRSIVTRTVGAGAVLRDSLQIHARQIRLAFIYGSIARGEERSGSDLDVLVVGETSFTELVVTIAGAESTLRREIHPILFSEDEFRARAASQDHFIASVIEGKKLFLIGDENGLGDLLAESMD